MKLLRLATVICTALIIHNAYAVQRPLPISIAKKKFTADPAELNKAKVVIITYYTNRLHETEIPDSDELYTGYEQEIQEICAQALEFFENKTIKPNDAVVLDIDETVLSNFQLCKGLNFESQRGTDDTYNFRVEKKCCAIIPMLNLCIELKDLGLTLIFISARRGMDKLVQATRENLEKETFTVDELFLMPMDLYSNKTPVKEWKQSVRMKLCKQYNILACFGDSDDDMYGECCGEKFKLPNYLY